MSKVQKENNTAKVRAFISGQVAKPTTISYPIGEGDNIEIVVNPVLPFAKRAEMVRAIAGIVFINKGEHINDYMPEYTKLAKKITIISYYTDFKLPKDVNDAWLVLNNTTLFDDVAKIIGKDVEEIFEEACEVMPGGVNSPNYLINKTDLNSFLAKISEKIDSFGSQFTEQDLRSVMKMMEKLPQNLSPESVVKAVAAVEEEKSNNTKN